MEIQSELFLKQWEDFMTHIKGKVLKAKAKGTVSFSQMKIILEDLRLDWVSPYDESGIWLSNYIKEEPEKGRIIKDILTNDMSFSEIARKKDNSFIAEAAVPVAAAATGFGIASAFDAHIAITVAATVAPAAAGFYSTKVFTKKMKLSKEDRMLQEYYTQLEKYKLSVLSVLEK